jgi:hypothetical protein
MYGVLGGASTLPIFFIPKNNFLVVDFKRDK